MMTAAGKLQALEISRDGAPVAVLEKSAFTLDGQSYTVRSSGLFARSYELHRGDEVRAVAKGAPFVNRATVTWRDKSWLLKAENLRATQYGLYDGETRVGGITPGGLLRPWSGATIDMPDELPLDVQLFLTSIVVSKWGEAGSST